MPRSYKHNIVSKNKATPLMLKSAELTDEVLRKVTNEKVFPKRSRWVIAGKIADIANDYETAIDEANKPLVATPYLRQRRFEQQQIALGKLEALDKKLNQAQRVLHIDPNKLEYIAQLIIDCTKLMQAWIRADEKRYGPVVAEESAHKDIVHILSA